MKSLSVRKADKEGHTAHAIADAIFSVTLMVHFSRRGEGQVENVRHLIDAVLEERGESSFHGFKLTADRGYGKISLVQELLFKGISAIFVSPEHLIRCHPFVGRSFLSIARLDDEESESEADNNLNTEEGDRGSNGVTSGDSVHGRSTRLDLVDFDRPRKFVVEVGPEAGQVAFLATKTLRGEGTGRSKITAVAVRERGVLKSSAKSYGFIQCPF